MINKEQTIQEENIAQENNFNFKSSLGGLFHWHNSLVLLSYLKRIDSTFELKEYSEEGYSFITKNKDVIELDSEGDLKHSTFTLPLFFVDECKERKQKTDLMIDKFSFMV